MKHHIDDDEDDDSWNDDYTTEYEGSGTFDEESDTIPCPSCGREMYEDAPRCPSCGEYPSRETHPRTKDMWFVLTVILCLLIVLTWFAL